MGPNFKLFISLTKLNCCIILPPTKTFLDRVKIIYVPNPPTEICKGQKNGQIGNFLYHLLKPTHHIHHSYIQTLHLQFSNKKNTHHNYLTFTEVQNLNSAFSNINLRAAGAKGFPLDLGFSYLPRWLCSKHINLKGNPF